MVKQSIRTVAAVVTTSLLAGGGLAATVTGMTQAEPQVAKSTPGQPTLDASQREVLSAALDELMSRNRDVRQQIVRARRQLHRVDARLSQERRVAERLAARGGGGSYAPSGTPATGQSSSSTPATHTTTRASGSVGYTANASTPRVHATTRASGAARPTGAPATGPKVHATTRASGSTGAKSHESEREDD